MANIFRRRAASRGQHSNDMNSEQSDTSALVGSPGTAMSYSIRYGRDAGAVSPLAVFVALAILGVVLGLMLLSGI
jgi:hypothetical protein